MHERALFAKLHMENVNSSTKEAISNALQFFNKAIELEENNPDYLVMIGRAF